MNRITRTCPDCNRDFLARAKNTVRCDVCRPLKDLKYLMSRNVSTTKCVLCDRKFSPIKFGEKMCARCNPFPTESRDHVTCAYCNATKAPLITSEVAVCWDCGHSLEHRLNLVRGLMTKQAGLREAADAPGVVL